MSIRNKGWLGWVALLILVTGGVVAYMLSLEQANPEIHSQIVLTIAVSIAGAGICLIIMTADWWMRH